VESPASKSKSKSKSSRRVDAAGWIEAMLDFDLDFDFEECLRDVVC